VPRVCDGMPMLELTRLHLDECDWDAMDRRDDRVIFQTREWLSFIAATQNAEPVVCALLDAGHIRGYFTGCFIRRYGVRILGSPFPGWTTSYMGFNLDEDVLRREAAQALLGFASRTLRVPYVELRDRLLLADDAAALGLRHEWFTTFEVDLSPTDDEILARMKGTARTSIRKAQKEGVLIEEASDRSFADDYYAQLLDVFAKQSLRPTYGVDRVRALIEHVHPTGRLLLLRARNPEGECIATAIFPAMNSTAYFWGGASWRSHQRLHPNEALFWYAMRYWRERGVTTLDMGGGGDYKRKFGVVDLAVPHITHSRFAGLASMRAAARYLHTSERLRRLRTSVLGRTDAAGRRARR
jgi:CelD/BcsL family acetyltransferase involved in cellulose biosynthesis